MRSRRRTRAYALVALATLVLAVLAACSDDATTPPEPQNSVVPAKLTFGVFGPPQELAAYRQVVAQWNLAHPGVEVTLVPVGSRADQLEKLASGADVPDVFLVNRRDLGLVRQEALTQPIGELMDQKGRDVDFGDNYPIDAVRAFAGDNDLQCMPYGYSPMVIYRNTQLTDLRAMARRGDSVPNPGGRWSFDQFAQVARYASRPGTGAAGVYIDPTLQGLAPFIYSGGGKVFDDPTTPTSLDFADGGTQKALETTLELLRDPLVTLSSAQLAQQTPLKWFQQGKLAMIAGFRSLTPQLRGIKGLHWDVMPMPVLGSNKTVGDVTGLCLSKRTANVQQAADFIYYASGQQASSLVAQTGYLDPANLASAASDAFRQPGRRPRSVDVFAYTTRDIVLPPVLDTYDQLDTAVDADLRQLVDVAVPGPDFLATLGAQIDLDSQPVLSPPSASPTPTSSSAGSSAGSSPSG